MKGKCETDKMIQKLKLFSEFMKRTFTAKLSIATYFREMGFDRFVPILENDGYVNMDDIKCTDREDFQELKYVLEQGLLKEVNKKDQKMRARERHFLKRIAMKPEKTWLPDQIVKEHCVRTSLMYICPKLSKFCGIMHKAIDEVDNLLSQLKARENVSESDKCNAKISLGNAAMKKLHVIENLADEFTVDEKEHEKLENQIKEELQPKQAQLKKLASYLAEIEMELASNDYELEELEEEIEELLEEEEEDDSDDDRDDKDTKGIKSKKDEIEERKAEEKELKKKRKNLRLKKNKLNQEIGNLAQDITQIEARRGEVASRPYVLKKAYVTATYMQDSTLQIIKIQSVARRSIVLGLELLKYKPKTPKHESKPLSNAITKGVEHIFENALQLSRISSGFFGYFMKLEHSFHQFLISNKMNKNVSLFVALEHVQQDIAEIEKFQETLDERMEKLRESIIAIIRQCATFDEFETVVASKTNDEQGLLYDLLYLSG
eukprot:168552_1